MSASHKITVVRIFDATPDELYEAWTDITMLRRWFGHKVEAEVRLGGRYRVENPGENGGTFAHEGEYQILEPGRRIRKTFTYVGTGVTEPTGYVDEYIDISFREISPGRTELTLVNAWSGKGMPPDEEEAAGDGWELWLDQLARALKGEIALS
jgi:uncharacterized protein YndB with AHSA1/START domain